MMRSRDPRIRQRINQISHNLESANESAQEGLYTFAQNYLSPCLESVGSCFQVCTAPCLPTREDHLRRRRRGRAEANFDFYDDWDNEEADETLLGWGTGELDRLLADNRSDPTVIPSSSLIGFLERFPWRFGAKGVKYRPSAADLQEHPGGSHRHAHEDEPLMETSEDEAGLISYSPNGRDRSATQSSRGTYNSLSSRGDLLPSDDEEDAVPLDDEFALVFGRRGTGLESDDMSGTKVEMVRSASGTSSLGGASSQKSKRKNKKKKRVSTQSSMSPAEDAHSFDKPSIADLKIEEEGAAGEEDAAIERKRLAAHELALKRGLNRAKADMAAPSHAKDQTTELFVNPAFSPTDENPPPGHARNSSDSSVRRYSIDRTEPFPPFAVSASSLPQGSPGSAALSLKSGFVKADQIQGNGDQDIDAPH
ncbi:Serine dehydratase-like [Penicillium atrosanguineum]|uniref:Serine dehydratase-like n=1 Tax=Penicillium atrosanguineum TaxID=1132637 RepID=UPI0023825234|nr:Serine dehydratase-like [Penicillium atrosanguineum]KAJ5300837.1 Serine dehydratase-like [Penicillium atrosanguineum]